MWYFQQVDEYLETLLLQKEVIYLTFFFPSHNVWIINLVTFP